MSVKQKVVRYWHTLKYLRPEQLYGRIWFRLWKPKPRAYSAPPFANASGPWLPPPLRLPSMRAPRSWVLLNEPGHLDELGWDGPQREKLWRYNQHYFDDLNAQDSAHRLAWHIDLIDDWVVHNPPGTGNGWEPYPLSLRVVNWLKWALGGGVLSTVAHHSLGVQLRWLTGRLEKHLLGNHLFANAKALVMGGLFFDGPEADTWLDQGLEILEREVPEQLLPDGGHFERSTMYHALALEDMLDLVNATQCFASRLSPSQRQRVAEWPQRARQMHAWLASMCHPDGEISFFNDAAFNVAPSLSELDGYARRVLGDVNTDVTSPLVHLRESGYVRLSYGSAVALIDVAPIGPDYLPGHAHADTLSFELSVGTHRLFVNSGTSCYGVSAERSRQRGTAAHNTVVINQEDSSEVWGGFRVARRAYPFELHIERMAETGGTEVRCAHDGYARLPGKPIHRRIWKMDAQGLIVSDHVSGSSQSAEARFHFHPSVQVRIGAGQAEGIAELPDGTLITWQIDCGQYHIESSTWHPRFGNAEPNMCLVLQLNDGSSSIRFSWASSKV